MAKIIQDNKYLITALKLIDTAKKMICISTFKAEYTEASRGRFTREIYTALANKIHNGIEVNLLLNWHANKKCVPLTNQMVAQKMQAAGATVKHLKKNRCNHAKLLIIDDEAAIIGSHNLSIMSLNSNFEMSVLLNEKEEIKELKQIYLQTFKDAKEF